MNRKLTFFLQAVLPTFTLIIGILIGLHYQDAVVYLEKYFVFEGQNQIVEKPDAISSDSIVAKNPYADSSSKTDYLPRREDIDLEQVWEVWDVLRDRYYVEEKVDSEEVLYSTISGMVDSLNDEYTVFLNPDDSDDFAIEVNGEIEGIGAEMIFRKKNLIILSVIKNSPAFQAGLKTDDVILKIDDFNVSDLEFHEAIRKIRGKKGTEVKLTVFKFDLEATEEVVIVRDKIDIKNVAWEEVDGYAHLMVNRFTQDVEAEFNQIANEILAADVEGIVLDLRDNGGGYMDQAVYIASAFIPEGVIVSRKYQDGKEDFFNANKKALLKDFPLVVLINGESASASEIVAGALQDYGLAKLIGEKSYGKGSVQQTYDFGKATLKFTVAKWFTPKKRNIDRIGLVPDLEVVLTPEDFEQKNDLQLKKAISYLQDL